ncbi:chromosome partitioning protein ParA, partial [Microcoleus sp. AT13-A5]
MTEKSSILVIASMHRSGSSLVASLLQSAGLHIGRKVMLYPDEGNRKGYFESFDFWHFHRSVLRSQGIDEDGWTLQENIEVDDRFVEEAKKIVSQNSLSVTWGWKEPRTTLFLEFWAELLPEANFLLIYRSPWEVIDSLYRRHDALFQSQPELAVKIWLHYNKKLLTFHNRNSSRCLLVNLSTIVKNNELYIQAINQKFNTNLTAPASTLYDPSLLHSQGLDSYRPTLIEHYFPEAVEMYQELDARAWQPQETPDLSWREQIKPSLYRFWAFQDWVNVRKLERENKALQSECQQCHSQVHQTQEELDQINPQLHQMNEVLEQSHSQLHQTEEVLEQSQSQLHQSQEELEQLRLQMNQNETLLEQSQSQLHQTEEMLEQSQSQLHQTEEMLEQSQSQLHQTEEMLEQSQSQLHQTEEMLEQSQSQLHQTEEMLEQSQSQLHQTEEMLEQSQSQLHQTEEMLEQSQSQLHQTEEMLEQSQSQL